MGGLQPVQQGDGLNVKGGGNVGNPAGLQLPAGLIFGAEAHVLPHRLRGHREPERTSFQASRPGGNNGQSSFLQPRVAGLSLEAIAGDGHHRIFLFPTNP